MNGEIPLQDCLEEKAIHIDGNTFHEVETIEIQDGKVNYIIICPPIPSNEVDMIIACAYSMGGMEIDYAENNHMAVLTISEGTPISGRQAQTISGLLNRVIRGPIFIRTGSFKSLQERELCTNEATSALNTDCTDTAGPPIICADIHRKIKDVQ